MEKPRKPIWFENGVNTPELSGAFHFGPIRVPSWVILGGWAILLGLFLVYAMWVYFTIPDPCMAGKPEDFNCYTSPSEYRFAGFMPLGYFAAVSVVIGGLFGITAFILNAVRSITDSRKN